MAGPDRAPKGVSTRWRILASVCLSSFAPLFLCIASSLISPTPEEDCKPLPLPTGEKVLPVTPVVTPPTQVIPGQLVQVGFSGGYVFLNYTIHCTDKGTPADEHSGLGTAHGDALAWSEYTQTTSIRLAQSEKVCTIELVVPTEETSYGVVCAAGGRMGRIRQEVLPHSAYSRTVGVYLDAERPVYLDPDPVAATDCEYQCTIEFVIPPDTLPGMHKLEVLIDPYLVETYEIEVVNTHRDAP